ncbi:MAG: glycosyltransferase family 2 protein [Acidimicrobiales bacterium]
MPTRDRHEFATRAVESALGQTVQNIEVITVDDGSISPHVPAVDERCRLIRLSVPHGVCAARTAGLRAATGEWITFLDDDDELLPTMVEVSLHAAARSKLAFPVAILSAMEVIDICGQRIENRRPVSLRRGMHYLLEEDLSVDAQSANSMFVPTDVLRSIGGWDERLRSREWSELLLRLNQVCSLQSVGTITYRQHAHDGRGLRDDTLQAARAMEITFRTHKHIFAKHRQAAARYLSKMGLNYLRAGAWGRAVRAASRAVLTDPTEPRVLRWWVASLVGPAGLRPYRRLRQKPNSRRIRDRCASMCREYVGFVPRRGRTRLVLPGKRRPPEPAGSGTRLHPPVQDEERAGDEQ